MSLFLLTFYGISSSSPSPSWTNFSVLISHLRIVNTKIYTTFLILIFLTNFCTRFLRLFFFIFDDKFFCPFLRLFACPAVYVIHSYPRHTKNIFVFLLLSSDLSSSFQIPSPNHAVAFHSCSLQQDVYNSFPHSFFISQYVLNKVSFLSFSPFYSVSLYIVTFRKLYVSKLWKGFWAKRVQLAY